MVNKYGADALRLYLINSPVVRAEVGGWVWLGGSTGWGRLGWARAPVRALRSTAPL